MSSRRKPRSGQASQGATHTTVASAAALEAAGDSMTPRQLARAVLLFSYTAWFALVAAGIAAYEGEPIRVKSRDLPLHWFDVLFRRLGALLLFGLLAARATAAAGWRVPAPAGRGRGTVLTAFGLYLALSGLRMVVYQLHVAGYIFTAGRWARDNLDHPPHVMSDHILLGTSLMAGCACEAALALEHLWHVRAGSASGTFFKLYAAVATVMSVLVSCECYFTARYFHPPHEILIAAILGLALFQAPPLLYCLHELRQHALPRLPSKGGGRVLDGSVSAMG